MNRQLKVEKARGEDYSPISPRTLLSELCSHPPSVDPSEEDVWLSWPLVPFDSTSLFAVSFIDPDAFDGSTFMVGVGVGELTEEVRPSRSST